MATAVMRPLARDDSMQRKWIDGRPTKKIAESFIKPNDHLIAKKCCKFSGKTEKP